MDQKILNECVRFFQHATSIEKMRDSSWMLAVTLSKFTGKELTETIQRTERGPWVYTMLGVARRNLPDQMTQAITDLEETFHLMGIRTGDVYCAPEELHETIQTLVLKAFGQLDQTILVHELLLEVFTPEFPGLSSIPTWEYQVQDILFLSPKAISGYLATRTKHVCDVLSRRCPWYVDILTFGAAE